jgi:hypothetical protein
MATIEQLRVLVQDPEGTDAVLSDDSYDEIIAIESNVYRAAATAARLLAATYAAKVKITAGPVSVENQQKYEHYADLAKAYDQRAREGGGGDGGGGVGIGAGAPQLTGTSHAEIDALNEDADRYASVFRRGVTDNPPTVDNEFTEEIN